MNDEFMKLTELCTRQGSVLDRLVEKCEANPGLIDTPEMQAEARRELEYAALLISNTGKELSEQLGVEA